MAGSTVNPHSLVLQALEEAVREKRPTRTPKFNPPRFGRVHCLDAEAFAQLCARLDPIPELSGDSSEGLPVCRAPAMKKCSSAGRGPLRICWEDDSEDEGCAGASDALHLVMLRLCTYLALRGLKRSAGVLPEVHVEKQKTWRGKASRQREL